MTLPAARLLEGMSVVRRRAATQPTRSVIVDALAWAPDELSAVLHDARADADPALEIVVISDAVADIPDDDRMVVVRLPGSAAREMRAVAINVALALSGGETIGYRTGHAGLDAMRTSRSAITWADPHLLLRDVWAADMQRRMTAVAPFHPDPLVLAALRRPRLHAGDDILDGGFLDDPEAILRFREAWVVPFVRRHFGTDPDLARQRIAARPLRLLVRGATASAGAAIVYGNFTRRYPTLLAVDPVGQAGPVIPDPGHDMLVNYRYLGEPDTALHDQFRTTGRAVVYAMDDNLLRLCEMPFFAHEPWISSTRRVAAHLADADMVLTWSDHCAGDVSALNPRVRALRTNIRADRLPAACSPPPGDGRIVYTTLTHNVRQRAEWWQQASDEWAAFFRANRDRARLVLFGDGEDTHALYARMFPGVDYEVRPPMPYDDYLDAIAGSGIHFVLAQIVEDTAFARSKCPIKLLEATAAGAVLIASQATAYESLTDERDCLKVAPRPGCWTEALERSLAITSSRRDAIWSAARALVSRDYTTEGQVVEVLLAHHLARLHALLGARGQRDGRPVVLAVVPQGRGERRTLLAWAWQLRRAGVRVVVRREGTDWQDVRPALILAGSPWSVAVAWGRAGGIACAALYAACEPDRAPASGMQPHMLLAPDGAAAQVARARGWPQIRVVADAHVSNETQEVVHDLVCALADAAFAARNN